MSELTPPTLRRKLRRVVEPEEELVEELPAWSLSAGAVERIDAQWPERVTREWAWAGATGAGLRVCIVDSGIERDHPLVGEVQEAVAVSVGEDGEAGGVAGTQSHLRRPR